MAIKVVFKSSMRSFLIRMPTTWLYDWSNLTESFCARDLVKALASGAGPPVAERTNGIKFALSICKYSTKIWKLYAKPNQRGFIKHRSLLHLDQVIDHIIAYSGAYFKSYIMLPYVLGSFTYDVSKFSVIFTPPSPLRHQSSSWQNLP